MEKGMSVQAKQPNEKPSEVIINKLDEIIRQLECDYAQLSESLDGLGGAHLTGSSDKPKKEYSELPYVNEDESFLRSIDNKLNRIKDLVSDIGDQFNHLNKLV